MHLFVEDQELLLDTYFDGFFFRYHLNVYHMISIHFLLSQLTRKNLMVKNLKRLKRKWEKEYSKEEGKRLDFFPTTYELPMEYHMFIEEFRRCPGSIWIMKPVAKSQGKGIFLFRKLKDIEAWKRTGMKCDQQIISDSVNRELPETYVVSRYITNPYLLCGRKFDLRVYVLVTSFNPMKVWVYRDGFARFSNTRFSLDSIDDHYIHLTNVAVQKTAPDYDSEKGSKWSIGRLRRHLLAKYGYEKVAELFHQVDMIFIGSLLSVQKIMINDKRCFELYGYDILLDDNLRPWLLEINASPSLTASSKEDYTLKTNLLDDMLDVVDLEGNLTTFEKRVGDFDLIWNDGPVPPTSDTTEGWLIEVMNAIKPRNSGNSSELSYVFGPNGLPRLNSYLGCTSSQLTELSVK
ncbi:putative tubulin polyglutamylase TTLL9 isoform 3 [Schistosoma japonicum]|uniref:Tubulin--tyrosine ligase-like protein 9 n=1 Tax=Schistosoma japonicum TaxID=6182 RepID=A0A4Z2D137_SCHJA|nr:putative tubulin polyglutamylase TTLL9 isoform 3 [Schistosoma japonicum]